MTASPRQRPALMAVAGAVLILGLALLLLRTLPPVQRWFFGKDSPVTYWRAQDRQALPALWEVIHSRLDLYHRIATSQARRSFVAAQSATSSALRSPRPRTCVPISTSHWSFQVPGR